MLVGLAAGVLMFVFAKVYGEPQIDKAIAFEDAQAAASGAVDEGAPAVSRTMQASFGLLTGTLIYAAAFGGIFAILFAAVYGRIGHARPRVTAAVLALVCFVVLVLIPFIKYPSNPPAVGSDETIGYRTEIYLAMVAISIAAAVAALRLGRDFVRRWGAWYGVIAAVGAYIVLSSRRRAADHAVARGDAGGLRGAGDLALPRRHPRYPRGAVDDARPRVRRARRAGAQPGGAHRARHGPPRHRLIRRSR